MAGVKSLDSVPETETWPPAIHCACSKHACSTVSLAASVDSHPGPYVPVNSSFPDPSLEPDSSGPPSRINLQPISQYTNIYAGMPLRVSSTTSNPPRVGRLRKGALFSPDCVPAPTIGCCTEALRKCLARILQERHEHCQRPFPARKRPHPVPASPDLP
jgi:hypothetical protein